MKNKNHYVAIMAGGIGSRFWPMSRTTYPKQFLDILNTGRTLIQGTYDRFKKFIPEETFLLLPPKNMFPSLQSNFPICQKETLLQNLLEKIQPLALLISLTNSKK